MSVTFAHRTKFEIQNKIILGLCGCEGEGCRSPVIKSTFRTVKSWISMLKRIHYPQLEIYRLHISGQQKSVHVKSTFILCIGMPCSVMSTGTTWKNRQDKYPRRFSLCATGAISRNGVEFWEDGVISTGSCSCQFSIHFHLLFRWVLSLTVLYVILIMKCPFTPHRRWNSIFLETLHTKR